LTAERLDGKRIRVAFVCKDVLVIQWSDGRPRSSSLVEMMKQSMYCDLHTKRYCSSALSAHIEHQFIIIFLDDEMKYC